MKTFKELQPKPHPDDKLHAILEDLLSESREVITINGSRFTGMHERDIKRVFAKYGIKYQMPF